MTASAQSSTLDHLDVSERHFRLTGNVECFEDDDVWKLETTGRPAIGAALIDGDDIRNVV